MKKTKWDIEKREWVIEKHWESKQGKGIAG